MPINDGLFIGLDRTTFIRHVHAAVAAPRVAVRGPIRRRVSGKVEHRGPRRQPEAWSALRSLAAGGWRCGSRFRRSWKRSLRRIHEEGAFARACTSPIKMRTCCTWPSSTRSSSHSGFSVGGEWRRRSRFASDVMRRAGGARSLRPLRSCVRVLRPSRTCTLGPVQVRALSFSRGSSTCRNPHQHRPPESSGCPWRLKRQKTRRTPFSPRLGSSRRWSLLRGR